MSNTPPPPTDIKSTTTTERLTSTPPAINVIHVLAVLFVLLAVGYMVRPQDVQLANWAGQCLAAMLGMSVAPKQ
jgi:hypothetical protein